MVTIREDGFAEFIFFRPSAQSVFLAGDFNYWRTDQLKMVRQPDGNWLLRLSLPAGVYKFRYIADGSWYTDFAAFGVEPGRFGYDSIIRVSPQALKLRVPAAGTPAAAAA